MKRLPEKLVMAAIILACGFVAHSDPVARDNQAKRTSGSLHKRQQNPGAAAAAARSPWVARAYATRAESP